MPKYIITAALPYAYSIPHLGNFVGSVLPADVYSKYLRMKNADVIFICGSDQHGTPIEIRAIQNRIEPEELADQIHEEIKNVFEKFECTFTHYGKTHSEDNKDVVYMIFDALRKNGYILEIEGLQAYCNVDKRFLIDRFIEGTCPHCGGKGRGDQCDTCGRLLDPISLVKPRCTICGKSEIEFRKVKNLAIDLPKLQPDINKFIEENKEHNWSKNAINKTQSYLKEGLKPREISRNIEWGFKIPLKGYENMVFYVWFDAFIGYIGMTKEWEKEKWKEYWFNKDVKLIEFMGKDNIEFHTMMWPATLIGSRLGFTLPYTIKASEYLTSKTVKFSKSQGIGLTLDNAIKILDADYWRFILMYLYPETADSDFTIDNSVEIVNDIMNDKIGNLLQRVLKMVSSNKSLIKEIEIDKNNREVIKRYLDSYKENFEKLNLREALRVVVETAHLGNSIMAAKQPWLLAKNANNPQIAAELSQIYGTLLAITYYMGIMLWPFAPKASMDALKYFGIEKEPRLDLLDKTINIHLTQEPTPIFKKIGKDEIQKLKQFER